jgi:hypothetical protein
MTGTNDSWYDRCGISAGRLGGEGEEGLVLESNPRKRKKPSPATETASPAEMIVPRESMALAQRLVRENICTDFIRTYNYAMHRKGKWTGLSETDLDGMAEMEGAGKRTGYVHDLTLELIHNLDAINDTLLAHYRAMHNDASFMLPFDATSLELCQDHSAHCAGGARPKLKPSGPIRSPLLPKNE